MRLGECVAADLFAVSVGQKKFFLLFVRSVAVNGIAVEGVLHGENHARRGTAARNFFNDDGVGNVVEARATFGFWKRNARKAELRSLLKKVTREAPCFIEFLRQRPDFRFRELAHTLLQQLLLFCQFQVHRWSLPFGQSFFELSILSRPRWPGELDAKVRLGKRALQKPFSRHAKALERRS